MMVVEPERARRSRRRWLAPPRSFGAGLVTALVAVLLSGPLFARSAQVPKNASAPQAQAALAGAQEAMERKDYGTAAMLLESFLFVYPGHTGALFNLAYCYSLQGRAA